MWALQAIAYIGTLAVIWGMHFAFQWLGVPDWFSSLTYIGAIGVSAMALMVLVISGGGGR